MIFSDGLIDTANFEDPSCLSHAIKVHLCGETCSTHVSNSDRDLLKTFIARLKHSRIEIEQLNELLLLLGQDRVNEGFFEAFFNRGKNGIDQLKIGIVDFRGYAMLLFGNFRFAYKRLSRLTKDDIEHELSHCFGGVNTKIPHPPKTIEIQSIPKENTSYLGYISKNKAAKEIGYAQQLLKSKNDTKVKEELIQALDASSGGEGREIYNHHLLLAETYFSAYEHLDRLIKEVQTKALSNTDVYLTWDFMDVYVATSMRQSWDFEDVFDLGQSVFREELLSDGSKNPLIQYELRFFDPTQSLCRNRIDKGLVEGLMLNRVICTIYMVQESDTLGKDSELASTLAQRKPVIAYVPRVADVNDFAQKLQNRPLEFVKTRVNVLQAEGVLQNASLINTLSSYESEWETIIDDFLDELSVFQVRTPFMLAKKEEDEFKKKCKNYVKVCGVLARMEAYNFNNRAITIQQKHPLAIQVDLQTGVANGVLVVREKKDCALLIDSILNRNLQLEIKHIKMFDFELDEFTSFSEFNVNSARKFYYDKTSKLLYQLEDLDQAERENIVSWANSICPAHLVSQFTAFEIQGVDILEEKISSSPFRVVTKDERLTNSFWNSFLTLGSKTRIIRASN